MNFTADVKKELISRLKAAQKKADPAMKTALKKAALAAFIKTSGELGFVEGQPTFFIVSETENVAEFFVGVFAALFGEELTVASATRDRKSGRDKLVLLCSIERSRTVMSELGLLNAEETDFVHGVPAAYGEREELCLAYIAGAFLGSGSCTLPSLKGKTGYHLEFVLGDREFANSFCGFLSQVYLLVKTVERKGRYVAYIKSKEAISDFLSTLGATNCLEKLAAVAQVREDSNNRNRSGNCAARNADKSAVASVKQIVAIEKVLSSRVREEISDELLETAIARKENPALTLQELADKLKISKSCLNHRLRKLAETAEKL
ncbi:MAG: DNA-binding protein WhiA [Clostridia bacterium]|nr:DNA-binding protein WhiA [Clostridia bacterium]